MSRKKSKRQGRGAIGHPGGPMRVPKASRSRWVFLVLLLLVAGVFGAGWWWWQNHKVPLPEVNLSQVDPKVAASLTRRMNEVRERPRSAEAWGWLGALLYAYDFRPAACECLARAARLNATNPRWPYYQALALVIATPKQAIPLLEQTVRLCGNSPETPRFRLARLLAEEGSWDKARPHIESLLAERPDFAPARLLAARAALAGGNLDKAIELARRCTDDSRTARGAWVLLTTIYRQKGDTASATQAAQRFAAVPEDEGFGDPFEAELSLLRDDPRVLSERAHPLLAGGHVPEAARLIERLRQEHPAYAETWLLVGRLHLVRKELPPAEQALRKHLELSPRSAQGLFQLGLVLLGQERFKEAASVFERATQLKTDYGPAYYNRGYALGRLGGHEREAIAAFRESLRHNPERLDAYVLLADLHLRLNEREDALAVLNQAQALNANDPRLRALRSRAERKGE